MLTLHTTFRTTDGTVEIRSIDRDTYEGARAVAIAEMPEGAQLLHVRVDR